MYSLKNNISQIVPAGVYNTVTDDFSCYANNFDLSLLSNDGEVPLSPQSQLTIQTNYLNQFSNQSYLFQSDYIPATIFNDSPSPQSYNDGLYNNQPMLTPVSSPQYQSMKTEKQDWLKYSMHEISQQLLSKQTNLDNDFLNQLTINYNYQYPSPLPSPPQQQQQQQQEQKFIPNYYPLSPANSICSSSAGSSPSQHTTTGHEYISNFTIKQEFGVSSLPPSPPDSNGAPSPLCCDIKIEPDHQDEVCIDIESLLNDSFAPKDEHRQHSNHQQNHQPQDHQLLREYLQDTSFQRKHNLKPVALESLIGGWSTRGDIEPVFSLALEQIKRDVQDTCALLDIPPDPQLWTSNQVQSWLKTQISTWNLKEISNIEIMFPENGGDLIQLSEDEFVRRVPESGSTLYAQLVVWKGACSEVGTSIIPVALTANSSPMMSPVPNIQLIPSDEWNTVPQANTNTNNNNTNNSSTNTMTELSDDDDEEMPLDLISPSTIPSTPSSPPTIVSPPTTTTAPTVIPRTGRQGGSHIHLWQFLKELLASPQTHGTAIRWLDRTKGVFKIEDSVRVARLWGRRKNRPAMNYDKLSRSIRQYYKKGIMKKTERSQRLVYQFCHPYCL